MLHTTFPDDTSFVIVPYSEVIRLLIKLGIDSEDTLGYGVSVSQTPL